MKSLSRLRRGNSGPCTMRRLRRAFGILAGTEADGLPACFAAEAQIFDRFTAIVSHCLKTQSGAAPARARAILWKNLATREDFENLKAQLRENTELVENIKADIGQRDWAAREWRNTRRIKLEE